MTVVSLIVSVTAFVKTTEVVAGTTSCFVSVTVATLVRVLGGASTDAEAGFTAGAGELDEGTADDEVVVVVTMAADAGATAGVEDGATESEAGLTDDGATDSEAGLTAGTTDDDKDGATDALAGFTAGTAVSAIIDTEAIQVRKASVTVLVSVRSSGQHLQHPSHFMRTRTDFAFGMLS